MITQERLKELFVYDKDTGNFYYRKIEVPNQTKIGSIAGSKSKGYVVICIDGKRYYAHRLAWLYEYGSYPVYELDHINNSKSDNRVCNLRDVPHLHNMFNQNTHRSSNKLKTQGVCKRGLKYRSQIQVNGRKIMIGSFDTVEEARDSYLSYKKQFHNI